MSNAICTEPLSKMKRDGKVFDITATSDRLPHISFDQAAEIYSRLYNSGTCAEVIEKMEKIQNEDVDIEDRIFALLSLAYLQGYGDGSGDGDSGMAMVIARCAINPKGKFMP